MCENNCVNFFYCLFNDVNIDSGRFACEEIQSIFIKKIGAHRYSVFNIYELKEVNYFGISGAFVSNRHHISLLTSAVRRFRPQHLIVFIGGNDFDSCDLDFSLECVVSKLTAYLTQLKRCFYLKSVIVLSFLPREVTRNIDCLIYNQRVK